MILTSREIQEDDIIFPFLPRQSYLGMTFGASFAGYDIRVSEKIILGAPWQFYLPRFKLASSVEEFSLPRDVIGIVHDKSTWARLGLAVQNTVIEAGWKGFLTLELSNNSSQRIVIQKGSPIAQVIFHRISGPVHPYSGKYQNQGPGPQPAIFTEKVGY